MFYILDMPGIKIFAGNSNKDLAKMIARHLGIVIGNMTVSHFSDGESNIKVNENIRGRAWNTKLCFKTSTFRIFNKILLQYSVDA